MTLREKQLPQLSANDSLLQVVGFSQSTVIFPYRCFLQVHMLSSFFNRGQR